MDINFQAGSKLVIADSTFRRYDHVNVEPECTLIILPDNSPLSLWEWAVRSVSGGVMSSDPGPKTNDPFPDPAERSPD